MSRVWHVDPVLHERLSTRLAPLGLAPSDWLRGVLRTHEHENWTRDVHVSTMPMERSRGFTAIDDPCGLRLPLRITMEWSTGIVHVREMPIGPDVDYVAYGFDDYGPDPDPHGLWDRPVVLVRGASLPDVGCAAMRGLRLGDVVDTGVPRIDDHRIEWASVEPSSTYFRLLHEATAADQPPVGLVLRLTPQSRIDVDV